MTDLRLVREFEAPPDRVFAYLSEPENLLKWWGPETMHVAEHSLDFRAPGPWYSVIVNAEGKRYKMSGRVVAVTPDVSIELTWGWHDETDARGYESRVSFSLAPTATGGTALTLDHTGLASDEAAQNHKEGWTLTLVKLTRLANAELGKGGN